MGELCKCPAITPDRMCCCCLEDGLQALLGAESCCVDALCAGQVAMAGEVSLEGGQNLRVAQVEQSHRLRSGNHSLHRKQATLFRGATFCTAKPQFSPNLKLKIMLLITYQASTLLTDDKERLSDMCPYAFKATNTFPPLLFPDTHPPLCHS